MRLTVMLCDLVGGRDIMVEIMFPVKRRASVLGWYSSEQLRWDDITYDGAIQGESRE